MGFGGAEVTTLTLAWSVMQIWGATDATDIKFQKKTWLRWLLEKPAITAFFKMAQYSKGLFTPSDFKHKKIRTSIANTASNMNAL